MCQWYCYVDMCCCYGVMYDEYDSYGDGIEMKALEIDRDVHVNSDSSKAFTIKANSKAFKVLIDSLYRDKIQSITREIWTNALDGHIAGGCPERAFDVSFPSSFDPSFRCRDYGIGLTHDQIMSMYTTLFESTKEDSNDLVGRLGIGSKTPFAYTDTFSVVSIKDGHKNYYSAILGNDGIPMIHHMHSEVSDEENGVEVSFPVAKGDIYAFQKAAKMVSLGFDIKPNVIGYPSFTWPDDHSEYYSESYVARMGCVIYPIDYDILMDYAKDRADGSEKLIEFFSNGSGIIDFAMGSLEFTASREALSYGRSDPTLGSLFTYFKHRFEEYEQHCISFIDSIDIIDDAVSVYYGMCDTSSGYRYGSLYQFRQLAQKRYDNDVVGFDEMCRICRVMKQDIHDKFVLKFGKIGKTFVVDNINKTRNVTQSTLGVVTNTVQTYSMYRYYQLTSRLPRSFNGIVYIESSKMSFDYGVLNTYVVNILDEPVNREYSRIRKYYGTYANTGNTYILNVDTRSDYESFRDTVMKMSYNVKFIMMGDLTLPIVEKRSYERVELEERVTSKYITGHSNGYKNSSSNMPIISDSMDSVEELIYIVMNRGENVEFSDNILNEYSKITGNTVYCINKSNISSVNRYYKDSMYELVELTTKVAYDSIYDDMSNKSVYDSVLKSQHLFRICEILKKNILPYTMNNIVTHISDDSDFRQLCIDSQGIWASSVDVDSVASILGKNGYDMSFVDVAAEKYISEYSSRWVSMRAKYPYLWELLNIVDCGYDRSVCMNIDSYIKKMNLKENIE